jgi:hypothetical protein
MPRDMKGPKTRLNNTRPLGVKIIAVILFFESAVLFISAAAVCLWPNQSSSAVEPFVNRIPYFKNLPMADGRSMLVLTITLAFAVFATVKGLGIWFMQQWARWLILIDLTCRFGNLLWVAFLLDRRELIALVSNSDFSIGFVINLFVLILLLDPNTASAFGKQGHNTGRALRNSLKMPSTPPR